MQVCTWALANFKLGRTWSGTCFSVSNRSLQLEWGCGPQELLRPDARSFGDWDRGTSYCLSPAAGGIHIVHMVTNVQMYILHTWTFLLTSQRGEQDEAHGAVYVFKCSLCPSVLTSASSWLYTCCVHVFVCVPTGKPRSASILPGWGGTELQQPCLWKAPGFHTQT